LDFNQTADVSSSSQALEAVAPGEESFFDSLDLKWIQEIDRKKATYFLAGLVATLGAAYYVFGSSTPAPPTRDNSRRALPS